MKFGVCAPVCQAVSVIDTKVHPEVVSSMNEKNLEEELNDLNIVEKRIKKMQKDIQARYSREVVGLNGEHELDGIEFTPEVSQSTDIWKRLSQSEDDLPDLPSGFSTGTVPRRKKLSSVDDSESDDATSVGSGESRISRTDRYGFIGGSQYTLNEDLMSAAVSRRRERKWLSMMKKWDSYKKNKFQKIMERCRKGIPSSLRGRAWVLLCGADRLLKQNPGMFEDLLSQPGDPRVVDEITRDLHRQFPLHEMFEDKNGPGQAELFKILKAYSVLKPVDGYCQGQAPIASVLLMQMPTEEAFWCLVAICDFYIPGYYAHGLEQIQVDGDVLLTVLRKVAPIVHKHLEKQKIDPVLFMTEWFMCVYSRSLPWPSVLRVWDMFLCERIKVLFRVAVVLLKFSLGRGNTLKKCPTMYETLQILKELPYDVTKPEFLIPHVEKINLSVHEIDKERTRQFEKREKAKLKKDGK